MDGPAQEQGLGDGFGSEAGAAPGHGLASQAMDPLQLPGTSQADTELQQLLDDPDALGLLLPDSDLALPFADEVRQQWRIAAPSSGFAVAQSSMARRSVSADQVGLSRADVQTVTVPAWRAQARACFRSILPNADTM